MNHPSYLIGGLLQTERQPDGSRILLRDLSLCIEDKKYTVPKGTRTDFSSIPWYGRWLVRWSRVDIAGVVHDWLYLTATEDRKRSDQIWRLVAISGKHRANLVQAWIGYIVLRAWGWRTWNWRRGNDCQSAA